MKTTLCFVLVLLSAFAPDLAHAQTQPVQAIETIETIETIEDGPAGEASPDSREHRLADYLTGATFTGRFTLSDRADQSPSDESYKILSCEKLPAADLYRLKVAIQYGDTDGEFPMDLPIIWAGNTPVFTLDAVWIPGLGTFSARVLLHMTGDGGQYAGTWQHDAKGGHLFGKISPREIQ